MSAQRQMKRPLQPAQEPSAEALRRVLEHVMGRVAAGDRAALDQLYAMTASKVLGVLVKMLRDRTVAEEVLQDTFVAVWRKAKQFDPSKSSPLTWQIAVARNLAIDRLRRERRFPTSVELPPDEELVSEEDNGLDLLLAQDNERMLGHCLGSLDADQQRAIRAAFFGGLTYEALAAQERLPLSTVKSRIRRGLARLRNCIERY
jgi:RNA polymerase sigma factor (sigma-70 family)